MLVVVCGAVQAGVDHTELEKQFGQPLPSVTGSKLVASIVPIPSFMQPSVDIKRPAAVFSALQTDHQDDTQYRGNNLAVFKRFTPANLFKAMSRSIVLILTSEGSGTGSIVNDSGGILTNWHVVGSAEFVDIIFRPEDIAAEIYAERTYRARVERIDQVTDLALLQLIDKPVQSDPIKLTKLPPDIGEEVFAIGHPYGYTWTMTQGIVTGRRDGYNWQYDLGYQHSADVVQTQTPINPGNSGGPLFNSKMEVVGVNSFGGEGQGTNFAVSAGSVTEFLRRKENRLSPAIPGMAAMKAATIDCDSWVFSEESWRNDEIGVTFTPVDIDCDGENEGVLEVSSHEKALVQLKLDTTGDGLVDVTMVDLDDNDVWDLSLYDINADGRPDIVGYHADAATPETFVSYARFKSERLPEPQ